MIFKNQITYLIYLIIFLFRKYNKFFDFILKNLYYYYLLLIYLELINFIYNN